MEDNYINKVACILISIALIFLLVFAIMHGIQANALEPTTITLKAGTYRFNDVLDMSNIPSGQDNDYSINIQYNLTINGLGDVLFDCDYIQIGNYTEETGGKWFRVSIDKSTPDVSSMFWGFMRPYDNGVWGEGFENYIDIDELQNVTIPYDQEVDYTFCTWFISNTNYNDVNASDAITIPYVDVEIPTDIQIMENINMDINGFGSTTFNDNVGITALNGDTLGRIRTNVGSFISFNGIAVTSFDSMRTLGTYVYPLTDNVTPTESFIIRNGLMLYVWDDTQYYQVAWYNPDDSLWYVHGDYAITVPYGHRTTSSIGTLTDGIAISLIITPNLTADDIGYVELGGFEDTPPYDNIITVADDDAYSTFAMFCNANFISDSEKLAWGIVQHQSGQNLGQSQQLGENILGQFLQAPFDILDSIVIYTTPNGTAVTLMGIFGAMLTLSLVIIFLKLFAGG